MPSSLLRTLPAAALLAAGLSTALCAAPAPRWARPPDPEAGQLLWIDPHRTGLTGADDLLFLHGALARLEDRALPTRIFEEEGFLKRTASLSYRLVKTFFLDLAPPSYLSVAQHEFFGHGYRAREAGYESIRYELAAPPPYGLGDGSTSWEYPRGYIPTPDRDLAMALAGIEAEDVLAGRLRGRWMRQGAMDYHEAWLYLISSKGLASYVAATDEEEENPSNDVAHWLAGINERYPMPDTADRRIGLQDLEDGSLLGFADPLFWLSAYAALRYLWNGNPHLGLPMVPIGPVRWLPLLGYRLTPFGDQVVVENLVVAGKRSLQARFARGQGRPRDHWSIDMENRDALSWRGFSLDFTMNLWHQPPLWLDRGDRQPDADPETGFGARADVISPVLPVFRAWPLRLGAGLGLKQAGYVPGQPLDGGLAFRVGAALYH